MVHLLICSKILYTISVMKMNKNIKVVYMGTPDFALPVLDMLIKETTVVLVVTQPDKETGRKKELTMSPVKKLALENKLGHRLSFNEQTLENLKDLDIFTYTEHDISETIDFLNKWIMNETDEYDVPYKLYTEEELDKLFDSCFKFTTSYLQKLKETKMN